MILEELAMPMVFKLKKKEVGSLTQLKIIQLLEENTEENLCDLGIGKNSLAIEV